MSIMYKSTRGMQGEFPASVAIIKGLADDGGLFVPERIPKLSIELSALRGMSYQETAYHIMKEFLTDYTEEELKSCIEKAYDNKFDTPEIAPLVKRGDQYFLELFHGATIAFKDMALSILPHLLTTAMKKNKIDKEIVILTATSGDTGKAALAGFADVPGTRIIVFYPKGGVSKIQELQMVTQKGKNTRVIGVHGNFDDCQTGVKNIFSDRELREEIGENGYQFSSANSINIGRLVPQIAYYAYAYGSMLRMEEIKEGDLLDVVVPTGNFGNILAAYYAKQMGIPIGKLVCASNENKVLFDFFKTGSYDKNREFILTSSPSMDILISSNLERLIYLLCNQDATRNAAFMKSLSETGSYEITAEMKEKLSDFYGAYATEQEVFSTIHEIYDRTGYVIDTHTAVAAFADQVYKKDENTSNKSIIVSTASPFKFTRNVMKAVAPSYTDTDDFKMVDELGRLAGVKVPAAIEEIRNAQVLHEQVCDAKSMRYAVKESLGM